ncbi:Crp/Fnr family transcriptional regulator (plasmid) [Sphingomonas paeninsulae]|uniref:Crp/Fnr family transcriptional regulator n=2 Tax=Sphingomonas paeninsulae TaxID=2319844 RepID=A0A494T5J6_SPHPE|nr:Crp/Fnr family transcriptional regulator [Sphingomonas paeninsulae]
MSAEDYAHLEPHLIRIPLPVRLQLHVAADTIEYVYFPEDGVVSIVSVTLEGTSCEVGLFGREGMSETATVLGTDRSPHEAYVQVAGASGLRLPVDVLNEAMDQSATLRTHLLHYVQAMMIQLSSSIAAAGQTIEKRLARWLLMCGDRIDGDEIGLTHDFIAMMLNVRRPGVSVALDQLENQHLIRKRRGTIVIVDQAGLKHLAGGSYGLAEREYHRLLGQPLKKTVIKYEADDGPRDER